MILRGRDSDFSTRVVVTFNPESREPEIAFPEICYSLVPGTPEFPYFIPRSDLEYRTQAAQVLNRGELRAIESPIPAEN